MKTVTRARLVALTVAIAMTVLNLITASPARASATAFDPVPNGAPGQLLSPANGQMWVAADTPGGLRIDRYQNGAKNSTTYPGVPSGTLSGTATDDVWLQAGTGLWHFDGVSWDPVELPTGPDGETLYPAAMDDVAGPDFYVMFTYFAINGPSSYATTLGHFDGSSWTLLGQPSGDYSFESVMKLKVTDEGIVALASGYRGFEEYVLSYVDDAWQAPVQVGRYFCCSVNKWAYDWVVESPTSIWLYGDNSDDNVGEALCAHFNGAGIDDSPCVTGRNRMIMHAEELPDGSHMVANEVFDRLKQPDQSTAVPAAGVTSVSSMAVEKQTGVVWAVVGTPNGSVLMRYGVSTDSGKFVVSAALAKSTVEKGDIASISGTIDPVPGTASQRTVVLEVKRNGLWKQDTSMRASSTGTYRFNVQQPTVGSFEYRVRKPAVGSTQDGVSNTLTLTVRQPFVVTASAAATVKKGKKLTISGKVTPKLDSPGERGVTVQVKSGSQWRDLVDGTTNASGGYSIQVIFKVVGTQKLRVLKVAANGLTERVSNTVTVTVVK